jgi:hypothetical protein
MSRLQADSPWVLVLLAVAFALITTLANLAIGLS